MAEIDKERLFLEVTSDQVKFYTFTLHALRILTEKESSGPISLEQAEEQLKKILAGLASRLDKSPVVMKKIEGDYQKTAALIEAFRKSGSQSQQKEEAEALKVRAQEKIATLSDLVAIFRSF